MKYGGCKAIQCIPAVEEWEEELPQMKCEDCPWYDPEMYDDEQKDGDDNG